MNFNPIFFQPLVNTQGLNDSGKIPKLNGKSYLFSDIIKVCLDKTAVSDSGVQNQNLNEMLFRVAQEAIPVNIGSGIKAENGLKLNWDLNDISSILTGKSAANNNSSDQISGLFPAAVQENTIEPAVTSDLTTDELTAFISKLVSTLSFSSSPKVESKSNTFIPQQSIEQQTPAKSGYSVFYEPAKNNLILVEENSNAGYVPAASKTEAISVQELINKIASNSSALIQNTPKLNTQTVYQVNTDESKSTAEEQESLNNFIITALQNNFPLSINIAQANGNNLQIEVQKPDTIVNSSVPEAVSALSQNNNSTTVDQSIAANFVNQKVINKAVNQNQTEPVKPGKKIYNFNNNPFTVPETNNSDNKNYSTATVAKGNIDIITENASGMKMSGAIEQNIKKDALDEKGKTEQRGIPEATAVSSNNTKQVSAENPVISTSAEPKEAAQIKTQVSQDAVSASKNKPAETPVYKPSQKASDNGFYAVKISVGGNKIGLNQEKITAPQYQFAYNGVMDNSSVIKRVNAGQVSIDFSYMIDQGAFSNEKVVFGNGIKTELKAREVKSVPVNLSAVNNSTVNTVEMNETSKTSSPEIPVSGKSADNEIKKDYTANLNTLEPQTKTNVIKESVNSSAEKYTLPDIKQKETKPYTAADIIKNKLTEQNSSQAEVRVKNYQPEIKQAKPAVESSTQNVKQENSKVANNVILTDEEIGLLSKADIVEIKQGSNIQKEEKVNKTFGEKSTNYLKPEIQKNTPSVVNEKPAQQTAADNVFSYEENTNDLVSGKALDVKTDDFSAMKEFATGKENLSSLNIKEEKNPVVKQPIKPEVKVAAEQNVKPFAQENAGDIKLSPEGEKPNVLSKAGELKPEKPAEIKVNYSEAKKTTSKIFTESVPETAAEPKIFTDGKIPETIKTENTVSVPPKKNTLKQADLKTSDNTKAVVEGKEYFNYEAAESDDKSETGEIISPSNENKINTADVKKESVVPENKISEKQNVEIKETILKNAEKPSLDISNQKSAVEEKAAMPGKTDIKATASEIKNEPPVNKQEIKNPNVESIKINSTKSEESTKKTTSEFKQEFVKAEDKESGQMVAAENDKEAVKDMIKPEVKAERKTEFKYSEINTGHEGNQVIKMARPEKKANLYMARDENKYVQKENSITQQPVEKAPKFGEALNLNKAENSVRKENNVESRPAAENIKNPETIFETKIKKAEVEQRGPVTEERPEAKVSAERPEQPGEERQKVKEQSFFADSRFENKKETMPGIKAETNIKNSVDKKEEFKESIADPVTRTVEEKYVKAEIPVKEVPADFKNEKSKKPEEELKTSASTLSEKVDKKEKTGEDFSGNKNESGRNENQETAVHTQKSSAHPKNENQQSFHFEQKPVEQVHIAREKIPVEYSSRMEDYYKTVKAPEVMKEISDFISKGETKSIVLKIDPENLGKVKIVVEMADKIVNANIEVENENVKRAVMNNLDNLKASLAQNGVQLNSVNVNLPGYEQKNPKQMQPKKRQYSEFNEDEIVEEARTQKSKTWGYNTYEYVI